MTDTITVNGRAAVATIAVTPQAASTVQMSGIPGPQGPPGPVGPQGPSGTQVVAVPYDEWPPTVTEPNTLYLRLTS